MKLDALARLYPFLIALTSSLLTGGKSSSNQSGDSNSASQAKLCGCSLQNVTLKLGENGGLQMASMTTASCKNSSSTTTTQKQEQQTNLQANQLLTVTRCGGVCSGSSSAAQASSKIVCRPSATSLKIVPVSVPYHNNIDNHDDGSGR